MAAVVRSVDLLPSRRPTLGLVDWRASSFARQVAAIRAARAIRRVDRRSGAGADSRRRKRRRTSCASLTVQLDDFGEDHGRFFKTPLGLAYDEREDRGEPPTAEQLGAIRAILDKYAELDAGLRKRRHATKYASRRRLLGRRKRSFMRRCLPRIEPVSQRRPLLRVADPDCSIADGDADEAVQRGIELLRLAALARKRAEARQLPGHDGRSRARRRASSTMRSPPADFAETARRARRRAWPARDPQALQPHAAHRAGVCDQRRSQTTAASRRVTRWPAVICGMQRRVRLSTKPCIRRGCSRGTLSRVRRASTRLVATASDRLWRHGRPCWACRRAAYEAHSRNIAVLRSLRVFNALRQFAERTTAKPTGLADLELPPSATVDPFDGQPLRLKLTVDGWIIYSVGKTASTTAATSSEQNDYGVGPRQHRARVNGLTLQDSR